MKTLIATACLTALSIGSALGADGKCDFQLVNGTIVSGRIGSIKATTIGAATNQADGQPANVAAPIVIESGTLADATLKGGKASGGRLVGKQCQGATLTSATLTGGTVSGAKIKIAGSDVVVNLTADATDVTLDDVTIDNPVAALESSKEATITTEASNVPLAGDWFKLKADIVDVHVGEHDKRDSGARTTLRIPKNTCFRVTTELEETTGDVKRKFARGTFYAGSGFGLLLPPFGCESKIGNGRSGPRTNEDIEKAAALVATRCATATRNTDARACDEARTDLLSPLDLDRSYDIPSELLISESDRYRYGWTWGVMVAPFKYYRGTREFSSGAQIGPYIGYRLYDRPGFSLVLAGSIGATSAKVTTVVGDQKTEETRNGFSTAVGLLTEFKNSFTAGFLWGRDMFSSSDAVPVNGKHWISISIGYKLGN
jgi:hypothetical protein